jgi:predicted acylesterase/phospholipase RssA
MQIAAWKPHSPWLDRFFYPLIYRYGAGYTNGVWFHHVGAIITAVLTYVLYVALGLYGAQRLGRSRTVPALASALMVVLVLGWTGSAMEFFLSVWHIPLLLLLPLIAVINSFLPGADHVYTMLPRSEIPAGDPAAVLNANGKEYAIVVAAAGGGIQAAAWTAQVLEGLRETHGPTFDQALRMISGISGGSMGSACYVNWLTRETEVRCPSAAARDSSLDEVAWGLAWPDLLRFLWPTAFGWMIDRAVAMERAWSGNAALESKPPELLPALSEWNQAAHDGCLPALVMNSTMVEVGGPLLLGTSNVNRAVGQPSDRWVDGDELHCIGTRKMDISVVRAARLSATFPYVTPVARPDKANHQPHMIDGGLFDNSGMATLTEWLDQALSTPGSVKRVLVLQLNGFPPSKSKLPTNTRAGWLMQLVAPLVVLINGRTAGQISHGQVEMDLLCKKWEALGIVIEPVIFSFTLDAPPLSWHLMPKQREAIGKAWKFPCPELLAAQDQVSRFLAVP